jgi:hypothetical protein
MCIYYLNQKNNIEGFSSYKSFKPYKHVKLNSQNAIDYVDDEPPCSRGEYSCAIVPCPSIYRDGILCWKCWDIEVDPQNE